LRTCSSGAILTSARSSRISSGWEGLRLGMKIPVWCHSRKIVGTMCEDARLPRCSFGVFLSDTCAVRQCGEQSPRHRGLLRRRFAAPRNDRYLLAILHRRQ
jgi:hypothetical protein